MTEKLLSLMTFNLSLQFIDRTKGNEWNWFRYFSYTVIIDSIISEVQDVDGEKCNSENELCVEYTSANAICLN